MITPRSKKTGQPLTGCHLSLLPTSGAGASDGLEAEKPPDLPTGKSALRRKPPDRVTPTFQSAGDEAFSLVFTASRFHDQATGPRCAQAPGFHDFDLYPLTDAV